MSKRRRTLTRAPKTAPVPSSLRTAPSSAVIALILAAIAVSLYANSWSHGYVGDDSWVTWSNAWTKEGLSALPRIIRHSMYFGAIPQNSDLYRPVAGIYFAVVGVIVGHTATGYHVANTLLYGLDVAALFVFLCSVGDRSVGVAFVASVFFIVHPIHTEVVDNIKSADELLCLMCLLVGATAWLRQADRPSFAHRVIAIVFYALACGCKETALPMIVIFPSLWYIFRQRQLLSALLSTAPFAIVAATYLAIRVSVLDSEPSAAIVTRLNNSLVLASSTADRLASALGYVAKYAAMLLWPHPLSFDYTYNAIPLQTFGDIRPWLGLLVCIAVGIAIVYGCRRWSVPSFAALWMAAGLVLVSNLFFLVSTNFGERLLYVPSVMACYLAAWLLARLARLPQSVSVSGISRSPIVVLVTLAIAAGGGTATLVRSSEWVDEPTLFAADLTKYPNSARLNNFVGSINYFAGERALASGDLATANADFTSARDHLALGLDIGGAEFQEIHAVLGMAEYQLKDCATAQAHLQQAVTFAAYRVRAMEMLGDCYEQGQNPKALQIYRQLDGEGVVYPHGLFELGNEAAARHDDVTSVQYFKRVVEAEPQNANAFVNLALGEFRLNHVDASLDAAVRCVAMQPNQARCLVVAAEDEARLGHLDKAAEYAARARAAIR